ncbi:leucine-rich repeat-containing G-protein coupled receptor 6-like [Drosophila kikkawai]|uniref:Leucine-rich repeat-containing G-protein coupled receptor 6-like n=1 Tax=Drosophila kikkawai TaxID=30033 RepID=A0ABM4GCS3_DROKI
MDLIPYFLLLIPALALGIKASDVDEDYTEETNADRREVHLDRCSNLTEKELPADLHTLALRKCSLTNLAAIDFNAVANLSVLQLRGGNLYILKRELVPKLPHLQILELQDNRISDIFFGTFEGLSQLRMLALNQNLLDLLNGSVFRPLPELRHLDLSANHLIGLSTLMFTGNPKLEVLLLRGNPFLVLWLTTFMALKNLVLLDLRSSGRYTDLELFSAETIILNNNKISRLEVMGEVSKLQAPNNELEHVRLEEKAPVIELDLHGNKLDTYDLSELLRGMWRLQILDISQNFVKELPVLKPRLSEVFLLPNLKFVNLSRNQLEHLYQDSPLLSPSLTHLDVSYNRIDGIEAHTFGMVENLQYLYLQGNLIKSFRPELFCNQKRGLKEVALYNNPIALNKFCQIVKYLEENASTLSSSKILAEKPIL